MQLNEHKLFASRMDAVGIPANVFAELAGCQEAEVSRHRRGFRVSPARIERMEAKLVELEDLAAADSEVKIDMTSIQNIRAAQKRLAEKRNAPATAPWQFRGAVASSDDAAGAVSIARDTLAGVSTE